MMKADIKQKWVDALRGGKYAQGTGQLRDIGDDTYCCLGVLCDLIDPGAWARDDEEVKWNWVAGDEHAKEYMDGSLPYVTLEQIHLDDEDENILILMNDRGDSFGEIAGYIEENL